MFLTANVSKGLIDQAACSCRLAYYANRVWPLYDYTAKGPGAGILAPIDYEDSDTPVLTVGVFEVKKGFELVWKESTTNPYLQSCIGVGGHILKKAITLQEIDKFCSDKGLYRYKATAYRDGSITIVLRSSKHGC